VDGIEAMAMTSVETEASLRAQFDAIARDHGPALQRFTRGYEADAARQADLTQEILVAIWRALPSFEGRSSLRTWVYRVAHNVAVSHVVKSSRDRLTRCVPLEDVDAIFALDANVEAEHRDGAGRVAALVRALKPADSQIILLYLEGLDHAEISDVTGLTATNVAVKVHRIKDALRRALASGGIDGPR
jgi:RNA polymerase sigma-70 factor, ECF subfamily